VSLNSGIDWDDVSGNGNSSIDELGLGVASLTAVGGGDDSIIAYGRGCIDGNRTNSTARV